MKISVTIVLISGFFIHAVLAGSCKVSEAGECYEEKPRECQEPDYVVVNINLINKWCCMKIIYDEAMTTSLKHEPGNSTNSTPIQAVISPNFSNMATGKNHDDDVTATLSASFFESLSSRNPPEPSSDSDGKIESTIEKSSEVLQSTKGPITAPVQSQKPLKVTKSTATKSFASESLKVNLPSLLRTLKLNSTSIDAERTTKALKSNNVTKVVTATKRTLPPKAAMKIIKKIKRARTTVRFIEYDDEEEEEEGNEVEEKAFEITRKAQKVVILPKESSSFSVSPLQNSTGNSTILNGNEIETNPPTPSLHHQQSSKTTKIFRDFYEDDYNGPGPHEIDKA